MFTEKIKSVVGFCWPDIKKTLAIRQEIIPDRVQASIELIVFDYAINKIFALVTASAANLAVEMAKLEIMGADALLLVPAKSPAN